MLATITQSTLTIRLLLVHVTVARGGAIIELIGSLLVVVALVTSAWAIGHAVGTPERMFEAIGRSKWRWVVAMVVLLAAGDATATVVVLYYLIRVRPRLNDVAGNRPASRAHHDER
ncbi:MAG: DUF2516 family protein [Acidimicrobiales bacterium]